MNRERRHAIRFALLLVATCLLAAPALADRVVLKTGEQITGKVILDTDDKVMIQTDAGLRTFPRAEVELVETEKELLDAYKEKLAALGEKDADGHFLLGLWCRKRGLESRAKDRFEKAIAIDPEHSGARKELGHVMRDGEWVRPEDIPPEPEPGEEKGPEAGEAGEAEKPEKEKENDGKAGPEPKPEDEEIRVETIPIEDLGPAERERRQAAADYWRRIMKEFEGVDWKDRYQLDGPGFKLHCNSTEEVATWYLDAITRINRELDKFFRKADKVQFVDEDTEIFVYKTKQSFHEVTGAPQQVGGFFNPMNGQIHLFHGTFGWTGNTVSTIGHEFTHKWTAMVNKAHGNMPPWIREGLAVYFADGIVVPRDGPPKTRQIPRDRLLVIQRAVAEKRSIPLKNLIRVPQGPGFTGFHYAHAWAVVYWMVESGRKNREIFNTMFSDCIDKRFDPKKFETETCRGVGGIEGFEERWKEWVLEQKIPPGGRISEGRFRSDLASFTVDRPSGTWRFVDDANELSVADLPWFQIVLRKEEARIDILAGNNPEHDEPLKKANDFRKSLPKDTVQFISAKAVNVNGYEAVDVVFEDKKGGEDGSPPFRYRRVFLTTPIHFVVLMYSAPAARFDEHAADFDKALASFEFRFDG